MSVASPSFHHSLQRGKVAETRIARWLLNHGYSFLPVYEIAENQYKGPQFFSLSSSFVAPDIVVFRNGKAQWIEAKNKSVFTWHRITKTWQTGIDLHHYEQYREVSRNSKMPVHLFFLHDRTTPDERDINQGSPLVCPSGLFGAEIEYLATREDHRHENWGRHGMVYWPHGVFRKYAEANEL